MMGERKKPMFGAVRVNEIDVVGLMQRELEMILEMYEEEIEKGNQVIQLDYDCYMIIPKEQAK